MSIGAPSSTVARGCARGRPASISANLGPCPRFDASLTTNEIKSFVLDALRTVRPQPQRALHLVDTLWAQASRDVQHSMKVRVSYALHGYNTTVALHAHVKLCGDRPLS